MRNPGRLLALAAAVSLLMGGVLHAQTVKVTNAPQGASIEVVLNAGTVGTATADASGDAAIPIDMQANLSKAETDVYIFIELCGPATRRIVLAERGQQPAVGAGCDRRDMGLFLLRQVSTVAVNFEGANPAVLLVQGDFNPRQPRPSRAWSPSPSGFMVFGSGSLARSRDTRTFGCGNAADCSGGGFTPGVGAGAAYWVFPFAGAEVSYARPTEIEVEGSDTGFQFTTALDAELFKVAGLAGIPAGPVRIFGKLGRAFHKARFATTQSMEARTVTIDGTPQTVPGGTQTFEVATEGWGWLFGGGVEMWPSRRFALYSEFEFAGLTGPAVDDSSAALADRMITIVVGARLRIGR